MMNNRTLQTTLFPHEDHCTEERLFYASLSGGVCHFEEQMVELARYGSIDFLSYFNAFSVTAWRKLNASLLPTVQLEGVGRVLLRCWLHRSEQHKTLLSEQVVDLHGTAEIELPAIHDLPDGLLAPELVALSEVAELRALRFAARQEPVRSIRLGIVITHFNRQPQVLSAARRLSPLLRDPVLQDKLDITVIDNSQNLPPEIEEYGISVIRNLNLGGSGGFARGMLHYHQSGQYTHCLFMDDDASCAVESIRRTLAALAFAQDDRTAIAGAMLYEDEPTRMHENGARFDGSCHSLDTGKDLRQITDLIEINEVKAIDYGAWWFFAFPLHHARCYPFPFFVRGDDIAFGLSNEFVTRTLNGVCSWQDRFEEKASPLTNYLDTRNHLMHTVRGQVKNPKRAIKYLFDTFIRLRRDSYLYESAEAALLAVEDVLQGPAFWQEHIDMSVRRTQINADITKERPNPVEPEAMRLSRPRRLSKRKARTVARRLTLNGLLIPTWALRRRPLLVKKSFSCDPLLAFRHRHILYYSQQTHKGFITSFDRMRAIRITVRAWQLQREVMRRMPELISLYGDTNQTLSSRTFWEAVYGKST